MSSPTPLTSPSSASAPARANATPGGHIGVFWDIENVCVPHGKSASDVVRKIRDLDVFQGKAEAEFTVVCDVHRLTEEISHGQNPSYLTPYELCF